MLFADLKYICATFLFSFQFFDFPLGKLEAGSMTRYFRIALFNILSTKGKNSLSCFFSTFNVQFSCGLQTLPSLLGCGYVGYGLPVRTLNTSSAC